MALCFWEKSWKSSLFVNNLNLNSMQSNNSLFLCRPKRNIMLQRIQSLYLFIAIVLNLLVFVFDLAQVTGSGVSSPFTIYGFSNAEGEKLYSTVLLAIIATLSILFSLIVTFSFKKRQLQIKLSKLNLFVQVGFVVAIFLLVDQAISDVYPNGEAIAEFGIGSFVSILPLLFIYLAVRGIKKDEALVRAADRIR